MTVEEWQIDAALKAEKAAWNIQGNWEREAMRAALEAAAVGPGTPTLSEPQIQAAIKEWIERFGSHGPGIPEITTLRDVLPYIYRAMRALEPKSEPGEWRIGPKLYTRNSMTADSYHITNERCGPLERRKHGHRGMKGDITKYVGPLRRKCVDWPSDGWGRRGYDKAKTDPRPQGFGPFTQNSHARPAPFVSISEIPAYSRKSCKGRRGEIFMDERSGNERRLCVKRRLVDGFVSRPDRRKATP